MYHQYDNGKKNPHTKQKKKSLRKSHTDVLTGSCEKETRAFATKLKSNCKRRSHDKKKRKKPQKVSSLYGEKKIQS